MRERFTWRPACSQEGRLPLRLRAAWGEEGAEGGLVPKHFVPTDEWQLAAQLITEEAKRGTREEPSGVVSGEQGPRGLL